MKIKDYIKTRREQLNLSQEQVAKICGVSKGTVSRLEGGEIENMKIDKIKALASALRIKPSVLIEDNINVDIQPKMVHDHQIPLYSSISCGLGMFIDDCVEDYIAVPDRYIHKGHEYFANTACGDSMIGAGIHDGDVLVFERTPTVENGEIGVFCIDNNDAVCKTFRRLSNGLIMLESSNPKYDPIMIDCTNECFRTIGKLIGSFRKF